MRVRVMDFLENEVIYNGEKYCFMNLEVAISYNHFLEYPFLVPVGEENFVLIEYAPDKIMPALKTYQEKGLKSILFKEEHYLALLMKIRVKMQQEFQSYKSSPADKKNKKKLLQDFEKYHPIVFDALVNLGINAATVNMAKSISEQVITITQDNNGLVNMLSSFRTRCQAEYVKSMCVSYLVSLMLDKCPWNSRAIQEKVVLGALLSDATLKRQDFPLLDCRHSDSRFVLSERILQHPVEAAKKLREQGIDAVETMTVIEEHHEMPDGSGYPKKLTARTIAPLSAIHIVARHFVQHILSANSANDEERPMDLDKAFIYIYNTFCEGNFKQACSALFQVLGKDPARSF